MIGLVLAALLSQEKVTENKRCIECHEPQGEEWKASVHARKGTDCIGCHGTDEVDPKKNKPHLRKPEFRLFRKRDAEGNWRSLSPEFCGKCHVPELEEFKKSAHFIDWDDGGEVKGCISCHAFHGTDVARRRAILADKVLGCLKCHKETSGQCNLMRQYSDLADRLEAELGKLEAIAGEPIPGLSWSDEEAAREGILEKLRGFRVRQHGATLKLMKETLPAEIPPVTAAAAAAHQKAEARKHAFSRQKTWALLAFLAVMVLNLLVARAWCLKRFGKH
jgi:predicted CXXCH cytochrome family protein